MSHAIRARRGLLGPSLLLLAVLPSCHKSDGDAPAEVNQPAGAPAAPGASTPPAGREDTAMKPAALDITSPAFQHQKEIPTQFTCEGAGTAPALAWTGVPDAAKSLALVVDDPDAPNGTWVHWVLYDMPPTTTGLPEGGKSPAGARGGKNGWGKTGWGAPCPPSGRHRYYFKLYALDAPLGDIGTPTESDLDQAMKGHVLASGTLMGTYKKKK